MSYLTYSYLTYSYLSDTQFELGEESIFLRHEVVGTEAYKARALQLGEESIFLRHEVMGTEADKYRALQMGEESILLRHEVLGHEAFISRAQPVPHESLFLRAEQVGVEVLFKIYNTTNIRILCEFQSRGLVDSNWNVLSGGTAAGDFSINNVNTDIPEEVYRSTVPFIILDCDAGKPQGVSPDTFVVWNHNLTSGAIVTLQASNDPGFGSTLYTITIPWTKNNLYFVTPLDDFPYPLARYFRIQITDIDSTDGYIEIGNILFGGAVIFHNDCITQNISLRYTEFKDEIPTEGYTTITNPRTLKKAVSLEMRDLSYGRGNYTNLINNVFLDARTSLRCVWIPYMAEPARFGVFGKLVEIPTEEHRVIGDANEDLDFVTMNLEIDEAL